MGETIFALSTVMGRSGVAIIKISGSEALRVLGLLKCAKAIEPRQAIYSKICDLNGNILDEAVILYFQGPNSFTGEDVIELHLHGSIAVINDVLSELSKISFIRLAEPGEFSKRAFLNGKIDLIQAEGLADLIEAETSIQRKIAIKQLGRQLEHIYDGWRKELISLLAQLEAFIDFPEEDIPKDTIASSKKQIDELINKIIRYIEDNKNGNVIMRGINVAVIGPPNSGKSSLINLLAKKEVSIVSDIAGTTRDVIQTKIDLDGLAVIFSDTAGIRESMDLIEQEGIRRAKLALEDADVMIIVLDVVSTATIEFIDQFEFFDKIEKEIEPPSNVIILLNKSDLDVKGMGSFYRSKLSARNIKLSHIFDISIKSLSNYDAFMLHLSSILKEKYVPSAEPMITRLRQKQKLEKTISYLREFDIHQPLDLSAQNIRFAAHALGALTGIIDVEEVLDELFSSFCIGK